MALGKEFGDRDAFLREFLDEFYSEADAGRRAAMLAEEPPIDDDARANAYYAAAAEHLALKFHLPVPAWTGEPAPASRRAEAQLPCHGAAKLASRL